MNELLANSNSNTDIKVGELLPCEADHALARQVFANLIGNAFKYSRKRQVPQIEATSYRDEEGIPAFASPG